MWSHFTYEWEKCCDFRVSHSTLCGLHSVVTSEWLPALQCCPVGGPLANAQHSDLTTLEWSSLSTHLQLGSVRDLLSEKRVLVSLARCRALERDKIDGAKFWRVTSRDDEIRYFWNQVGPYGPSLLCPHPAFCLWKNFSQRGSLIRDMRKCRSKEKQLGRIKQ